MNDIQKLFKDYHSLYASYVIADRAIPASEDGLKPVQRRILHAMRQMGDGRYDKVANITGETMKYHPHGDMSIYQALINVGQKNILIDTQGNWGNILTGDKAAAGRYIEARLTPLANNMMFSPKVTNWLPSYDQRNKEPSVLPSKIPLLLMTGAEGIAVGLSTKILPHNPVEVLNGAITYIKSGRNKSLYPDFPQGGIIDVSNYNNGKTGGKVKVRARIRPHKELKNCLEVYEVPYSTTTGEIADSITKETNNGKLPVKKVIDNTAEDASILIYYDKGTDVEKLINLLYYNTKCQVNISPTLYVLRNKKPVETDLNTLLRWNVEDISSILKKELEILLAELKEKERRSLVEEIFIKNEIYQDLKKVSSNLELTITVDSKMSALCKKEGVEYNTGKEGDSPWLIAIPFRRLAKFDFIAAQEKRKELQDQIKDTLEKLKDIPQVTIDHLEKIKTSFKSWKRKTEISDIEDKKPSSVQKVTQEVKVNISPELGLIGTAVKGNTSFTLPSNEFIVTLNKDVIFQVSTITKKRASNQNLVIAKPIMEDKIFTVIYTDSNGITYIKKFETGSFTRNKNYIITKSKTEGKLLYAGYDNKEVNYTITLDPSSSARKKVIKGDSKKIGVKGRASGGNVITKEKVEKITTVLL